MSLFKCRKCGCAEDTALCHYWSARLQETALVCSACDPKIAKWHGEFPREPFELHHEREIERFLEFSWAQHPNGDFGRCEPGVGHDRMATARCRSLVQRTITPS